MVSWRGKAVAPNFSLSGKISSKSAKLGLKISYLDEFRHAVYIFIVHNLLCWKFVVFPLKIATFCPPHLFKPPQSLPTTLLVFVDLVVTV